MPAYRFTYKVEIEVYKLSGKTRKFVATLQENSEYWLRYLIENRWPDVASYSILSTTKNLSNEERSALAKSLVATHMGAEA